MFDLTYLSLGAGVQSSAMLVCSNLGLHGVPRADVAIFADTQQEPPWVYETLKRLREWSEIPVEVCTAGDLLADMSVKGWANAPLFTRGEDGNESMLRRQCTREYKMVPIEKHVRVRLGYKPRQRIKESVRCLIGISLDEVSRMKESRTRWITNAWPLVDARLYRRDCEAIVDEHLGFKPRRSACVFCPYRSDMEWRRLREEHPEQFERACQADESMRTLTRVGAERPAFVHRSLVSLRDANFNDSQGAFAFDGECEGMCGV